MSLESNLRFNFFLALFNIVLHSSLFCFELNSNCLEPKSPEIFNKNFTCLFVVCLPLLSLLFVDHRLISFVKASTSISFKVSLFAKSLNRFNVIMSITLFSTSLAGKLKVLSSKLTNIPIKYVSCLRELVDSLPDDLEGDILPIDLYMREEWM